MTEQFTIVYEKRRLNVRAYPDRDGWFGFVENQPGLEASAASLEELRDSLCEMLDRYGVVNPEPSPTLEPNYSTVPWW